MTAADAQWPRELRRKVALLLVAKLCALMLIAWLFFPARLRPHLDGAALASHLLPKAAVATEPKPHE